MVESTSFYYETEEDASALQQFLGQRITQKLLFSLLIETPKTDFELV